MGEQKKHGITPGKVLMALGLVLLLCAGGLLAYNQWDDYRAGQESESAAVTLAQEIQSQKVEVREVPVYQEPQEPGGEAETEVVKAAELDGAYYMGVLTIPKLDRVLPVQSDWSMAKLKRSPCRYSGSLNQELVIAAHNYRKHFGGMTRLSQGDSVVFTDMEGRQYFYEVREVCTTEATDVEGMTHSGYDLTLFTCNYDGQARVTVRCQRAEG